MPENDIPLFAMTLMLIAGIAVAFGIAVWIAFIPSKAAKQRLNEAREKFEAKKAAQMRQLQDGLADLGAAPADARNVTELLTWWHLRNFAPADLYHELQHFGATATAHAQAANYEMAAKILDSFYNPQDIFDKWFQSAKPAVADDFDIDRWIRENNATPEQAAVWREKLTKKFA